MLASSREVGSHVNPDCATIEISDIHKLPTQPLVSVYMLTYNHEKFIAQAIDGVIAQRCDFPIELIIGEDCSTDRTGTIVREYQKQHPSLIRVITATRNVGAHANAARCRDAARGEYIAICEGDDYWQNPDKLELQIASMSASSRVTLCHTEFDRRIGFRIKRNRHQSMRPGYAVQGNAYVELLQEWTVMTATSVYRADVIAEFRRSEFHNPAWPFGDYNLALFASVRGHVAYLPVSTATWRRVAGSASNSGPQKALEMHAAATECRKAFMRAYPVTNLQRLKIEQRIHEKYLELAFLANRPDIYRDSLDWLIRHGHESKSAKHTLRQLAMENEFVIGGINKMRTLLRTVASYQL
jgi:glycosyltransferase involved in cell wall biosynthesis